MQVLVWHENAFLENKVAITVLKKKCRFVDSDFVKICHGQVSIMSALNMLCIPESQNYVERAVILQFSAEMHCLQILKAKVEHLSSLATPNTYIFLKLTSRKMYFLFLSVQWWLTTRLIYNNFEYSAVSNKKQANVGIWAACCECHYG